MKVNMLLFIAFLLLGFTSFAEEPRDTVYKSDSWWHIGIDNLYKDNSRKDSTDHFIHEKVEILKSDKEFKVTIGDKVKEYMIVSAKRFVGSSISSMQYEVSLNGKSGEVNVTDMKDGSYYVNIDWEIGCRMVQTTVALASLGNGSK